MATRASSQCGGHITLLFSIDKSTRLKRSQGSRGAGFSITHGVEMTGSLLRLPSKDDSALMNGIVPDPKEPSIQAPPSTVSVRDRTGAPIEDTTLYLDYIDACRDATLLRPEEWLEVEVQLACPTSQGFGMSAAGLLALGSLIHQLSQRGRPVQYQKIAHRIEREHGAGLGDVLGMTVGGVELRLEPGAPGWPGQAVSFEAESSVLLVWDGGEKRHTSLYIDDPNWQEAITRAGDACVHRLSDGPWDATRWSDLLEQSRSFATSSGMLTEQVREHLYRSVVGAVGELGLQASLAVRLCMLGSSVAVIPRRLEEPLEDAIIQQLSDQMERLGFSTLLTAFGPAAPMN